LIGCQDQASVMANGRPLGECRLISQKQKNGVGYSVQVFMSKCFNCAYVSTISVGRTRRQPPQDGLFPIFCDQCMDITSANYGSEPIQCQKCQSENFRDIDDPSVYAGDGEFAEFTWFGKEMPGTHGVRMFRRSNAEFRLSLSQKLSMRFLGYYKTQVPNRAMHTLTNGHYLCPRCLTLNLKLTDGIIAYFD